MVDTVSVGLSSAFEFLGLRTPLVRFLATTALGTAGEFYIRPRYAFDENGDLIPWAMISSEPGTTYTPVGFYPGIAGITAALFI